MIAAWATPLRREAIASAAAAALLAALLAWFGPPGSDFAAHAYQRTLFIQHGFELWNNLWYAGRYSFVTYSLLYYPLAALLGLRLLVVATIATAALAFTLVVGREWGPAARWSSRTFAVVWAGVVLSAAFPFALGAALALLAIWALQCGARVRFVACVLLTLAASPIAFLLLAVALVGLGLARVGAGLRPLILPIATIAGATATEIVLWRLFPGGGRFPFSLAELLAACIFCTLGLALTRGVPRAQSLRGLFLVYLGACVVAYAVPSGIGENIARLRYAAVPLAVLVLALRGWRPILVSVAALVLAISWNATPLVASFAQGEANPASHAAYWVPALRFLHTHLGPSYRVEAVDTQGHWPALYLARAGVPLARGWFRQDDFPQNEILYDELAPRPYLAWLHRLAVRYVVLSDAPADYSARAEAALLRSGRSGLQTVLRTAALTIYAVPAPRPLVSPPARLTAITQDRIVMRTPAAGRFRVAVRYSPYWHASGACLSRGGDGMLRVAASRAGRYKLQFAVDADGALQALAGNRTRCNEQ